MKILLFSTTPPPPFPIPIPSLEGLVNQHYGMPIDFYSKPAMMSTNWVYTADRYIWLTCSFNWDK